MPRAVLTGIAECRRHLIAAAPDGSEAQQERSLTHGETARPEGPEGQLARSARTVTGTARAHDVDVSSTVRGITGQPPTRCCHWARLSERPLSESGYVS